VYKTEKEVAEKLLPVFQEWAPSGTALSRQWLRRKLNCGDRILRRAITYLREEGHLIIAERSGGYRLARNEAEVAEYTASLKSRITSLREVVVAMEAATMNQFGRVPEQPSLL
jgi:biotin operon repressor